MKRSFIDEKAIISGLQAGGTQRRLFERKLYEHFFYLIKKGVWKYGLDEEVCASAYSDTIIRVIEHIVTRRFEGKCSLETYTHQIFLNKCVDELRKMTTNKARVNYNTCEIDALISTLPDSSRDIVQQMIEKSDRALLMDKLRELGEKYRQLLLLYEDGYSDQEIADQMQYHSAQVVKTTRLRGLEKLRKMIFGGK
jgi:RNA polymerase sigma-70 factor (ECF subfamily)